MCEIMERYLKEAEKAGKEAGVKAGEKSERIRTIQNMLAKGFAKDVIRSLDYTKEEIGEAEALLMATV